MTVDTYHKYLLFLAGECGRAMSDPSDDVVIRLTSEVNDFKGKCAASSLPIIVKAEVAELHIDFSSKKVERGSQLIWAGVLTLGLWALLLQYRRNSERRSFLLELKTDLEALAMRSKMRDL